MSNNNETWISSGGVCADCGRLSGFTHAPDCPTKLPRERTAVTVSDEPKHYPPNAWHNPRLEDEPRKAPSCRACGAIVGSFHAKGCTIMQEAGLRTDIRLKLNNLLTHENEPVLLAVLAEGALDKSRDLLDLCEDLANHGGLEEPEYVRLAALAINHLIQLRPRQDSNLRSTD